MKLKLLLDQNLSRKLVSVLDENVPGSTHVSLPGLSSASDAEVWITARNQGFAIRSKHADFHQLSFLYGSPPKTVWLRVGNCSTADIAECLKQNADRIREFLADVESALLVLGELS